LVKSKNCRNFAVSKKIPMETTTIKRETRAYAKNKALSSKRLSKIGEFWRKYPNGVGIIVDHKAVLK